MSYNGPLNLRIDGARGNPRAQFLVAQGRRMLGLLDAVLRTNPAAGAVARSWGDKDTGYVRVVWTPQIKSCHVQVPQHIVGGHTNSGVLSGGVVASRHVDRVHFPSGLIVQGSDVGYGITTPPMDNAIYTAAGVPDLGQYEPNYILTLDGKKANAAYEDRITEQMDETGAVHQTVTPTPRRRVAIGRHVDRDKSAHTSGTRTRWGEDFLPYKLLEYAACFTHVVRHPTSREVVAINGGLQINNQREAADAHRATSWMGFCSANRPVYFHADARDADPIGDENATTYIPTYYKWSVRHVRIPNDDDDIRRYVGEGRPETLHFFASHSANYATAKATGVEATVSYDALVRLGYPHDDTIHGNTSGLLLMDLSSDGRRVLIRFLQRSYYRGEYYLNNWLLRRMSGPLEDEKQGGRPEITLGPIIEITLSADTDATGKVTSLTATPRVVVTWEQMYRNDIDWSASLGKYYVNNLVSLSRSFDFAIDRGLDVIDETGDAWGIASAYYDENDEIQYHTMFCRYALHTEVESSGRIEEEKGWDSNASLGDVTHRVEITYYGRRHLDRTEELGVTCGTGETLSVGYVNTYRGHTEVVPPIMYGIETQSDGSYYYLNVPLPTITDVATWELVGNDFVDRNHPAIRTGGSLSPPPEPYSAYSGGGGGYMFSPPVSDMHHTPLSGRYGTSACTTDLLMFDLIDGYTETRIVDLVCNKCVQPVMYGGSGTEVVSRGPVLTPDGIRHDAKTLFVRGRGFRGNSYDERNYPGDRSCAAYNIATGSLVANRRNPVAWVDVDETTDGKLVPSWYSGTHRPPSDLDAGGTHTADDLWLKPNP